jgi:hypothetical protein
MTPISFYVQIVKALDEIGAPYMIVGAFERHVRRNFVDPAGNAFSAWVAQPTDIIIGN